MHALPALQRRNAGGAGRGPQVRSRDARRRAARRQGGSQRQAVRRPGRTRPRPGAGGGGNSPHRGLRHQCGEAFQARDTRGKRRLHKRPNAYEIERCKIWLDLERAIVKPAAIVALGATAARSLLGRPVTIGKLRGQTLHLSDGTAAFVTIHPSWLLRIEDDVDKEREYANFVADLRPAASVLRKKVA